MESKTVSTASVNFQIKKKGQTKDIWKRFCKRKTAVIGLVVFCTICLLAVTANLIVPYSEAISQNIPERLQSPSGSHWAGTDQYGRDIFFRLLHGARYSIGVGIIATLLSITGGGLIAAACAYYGGKVDSIVMRLIDIIMCIPMMLLTLAVVAVFGTNLVNLLLAMTITSLPNNARVFRSAILPVIGQDYIEAARSCGTPDFLIIIKHVLPNAIGPIIVRATMSVSALILTLASVSYLGMGIQPPSPEWGAMLSDAKAFMLTNPYMVFFPGLAIGITALSINLMGDGLRDALDPKLKD